MTRLTPTLIFQRIDEGAVLLDESSGDEILIPDDALPGLARTADYFSDSEVDDHDPAGRHP